MAVAALGVLEAEGAAGGWKGTGAEDPHMVFSLLICSARGSSAALALLSVPSCHLGTPDSDIPAGFAAVMWRGSV